MSNKTINTMHDRDMHKENSRARVGKIVSEALNYVFLLIMAAIVLFPFYWMIISSLKSLDEYRMSTPTFWPRVILLSNYVDAFTTANLGRLFLSLRNSPAGLLSYSSLSGAV